MSTRRTLEAAKARAEIVRVYREGLEDGWVSGFVTALGPEFFALQVTDKACRLDGYNCLRYGDISDCIAPDPYAEFMSKALAARGKRLSDMRIEIDSLPALIRSASSAFPLVSIFYEGEDNVCYIGRVVDVSEKDVRLLEITPGALWDEAPTLHLLDGVTRVDFGGAYEAALNLVSSAN